MDAFTTLPELLTLPGVSAFVLLVVQYIKAPLDRVLHIPTRLLVYMLALVILLLGTGFTSGLNAQAIITCIINAVIAAFTAMGAYETLVNRTQ